jgi:hypothetical protein
VVFLGGAIWYVMHYAATVKRDPSRSVVGVGAGKLQVSMEETVEFTPRRKVIMAVFAAVFLLMIYSVIPFDELGTALPALGWWFPELSALFLVGGVVIGLIARMGEEELVEWKDTNVPLGEIDSHLWGFVGNPLATKVVSKANTGYAIASTTSNKEGGAEAEGVKACAYADATEYIITCNTANNTNSSVSFCLRKPNENYYLNGKDKGYVGQWNMNGHGSTFNVEEYEETVATVSGAANYATLVLDYNAIIPEGVVAYVVSDNNETSATLEEVEGILPANTGVVLKNAGNHTFKKVCAATSTSTIQSNLLFGYTNKTVVSESEHEDTGENGTVYALAKGDDGVAFYHYTGENYLAGKAYLQVSNDSGARSLVFNFNDDNATAIENLETTNEKQQSEGCEIYDLTGRRLQGVQKGLYIINGKKIVR